MNLRDITAGSGPFPDSSNFADAELDAILTQEGNVVMRAVAACLEILASAWASYAGSLSVGSRSEASQQAQTFADLAAKGRAQYGGAAQSFVAEFGRSDGYHTSNPRTDSGSELSSRIIYIRT